jgi:hypothetical protein
VPVRRRVPVVLVLLVLFSRARARARIDLLAERVAGTA